MKKIISVFLALTIFCFSASAAGMTYTFEDICAEVSFPETYRVLTSDNLDQRADLLAELGYTKETMENIFKTEAAFAIAFSMDRDAEIWFRGYTTSDSEQAFNMDDFTAQDRQTYIDSVTADTQNTYKSADFIRGENGVFFRTEYTDGTHESVTYITIKNGAYYTLTLSKQSEGELTPQQLEDIKQSYMSLKFTEIKKNPNKTSISKKVLLIICTGILSVSAFAIAVVVLKKMGYIGKKDGKSKPTGKPKKLKLKK
ncbi:MAG: hypothetical protein IJL87_07090 [Clostridia bacterium]|nr:hypothetical protein [Clostridia bacterium]